MWWSEHGLFAAMRERLRALIAAGTGWILEGKINYGSQSTWLKHQGRRTVMGSVSIRCQTAIFHGFVSLVEVKPIWASFINLKAPSLPSGRALGAGAPGSQAEVGHGERERLLGTGVSLQQAISIHLIK